MIEIKELGDDLDSFEDPKYRKELASHNWDKWLNNKTTKAFIGMLEVMLYEYKIHLLTYVGADDNTFIRQRAKISAIYKVLDNINDILEIKKEEEVKINEKSTKSV